MEPTNELKELLRAFLWAVIVCAIITALTSCAHTKYVTVPEIHKEYVNVHDTVQAHDSVYMHDSIMCIVRGDSVFTDRWHTKYIEKLKYVSHTDTVCKRDSITVPVVQEVIKTKTDYKGWFVALALAAAFGLFIKIKKLL